MHDILKRYRIATSFFFLLVPALAFGAPSFLRGKTEPVEKPGIRIQQRLVKKFFTVPYRTAASYPPSVNILFLRVDFPADTCSSASDPGCLTSGTGEWSNCTSACNGDPEYWVNNSQTNFINYWNEVSYGQLKVTITISPAVYRLPHDISYYGSGIASSPSIENLIYDSITSAENDPLNPLNNLGTYDAILIVHAGAGQETDAKDDTPNDIWSLYYFDNCISPNDVDAADGSNCIKSESGAAITEAIIMPQTDSQDGIAVDPVGVYLHEFGHWLGLPDLYCTAVVCSTDGVGDWSLMDSGSYNADPALCTSAADCLYGSSPSHLDAWSKVFLGFVSPQALATSPDPGNKNLNDVESNPEIIKLPASSSSSAEYFLLENRQLNGFDKGLPGHGLLVWLINEATINNKFIVNTVNNDRIRPGIKIVEADGNFNLLNASDKDLGSPSDPYPGSKSITSLSPQTNPSSLPYTAYGWVNLRNITELSGFINFSSGFSPLPPQNVAAKANVISWTVNMEPDFAFYRIYRNGIFFDQATSPSYTDTSGVSGNSFKITAVDINNNESEFSSQVVVILPQNSSGSGGGGGGCFIATAAYGSYMADDVMVLRKFRDEYLLTNSAGRAFVEFYYKCSPSVASIISKHDMLRSSTRVALTLLVYAIKYPLPAGIILVLGGLIFIRRKFS